jgi:hypothetical protein
MEFYWTVIAAIFGGVWTLVTIARDQRRRVTEDSQALIARLRDSDRYLIEHHALQKYISLTAHKTEEYFRDKARLSDAHLQN